MGAPKAGVWQNLEIPLPELETLRILHFQGIRKKTKKIFSQFFLQFFFKNIFFPKFSFFLDLWFSTSGSAPNALKPLPIDSGGPLWV